MTIWRFQWNPITRIPSFWCSGGESQWWAEKSGSNRRRICSETIEVCREWCV